MQMKQFVTVDKSPVLKAHQRSLQITGNEFAPPLDALGLKDSGVLLT